MRRAIVVLPLAIAASLAGWAAGGAPSIRAGGVAAASHATARTPSGGFVVRPDIADPRCNGGRGIRLRTPFGGREAIETSRSATIAGGTTLIAFSDDGQAEGFAVLDALTPGCGRDRVFGRDGTAKISIPSSFRPKPRREDDPERLEAGPEGLVIEAVAAGIGGGAIVAGSDAGDWVVGEVSRNGELDRAFAREGWAVLPYSGQVTAAVQERSGRILIAGSEDASGCCTVNWAAALSARGQLERGFGTRGRARLPTGEDSGIKAMASEPDGEILVDVGHGNMGCWETTLAMLSPSGRQVSLFARRLRRFWQTLGFHAFVGDTYIDPKGFTLVGTGQRPCYDEPPGSVAPAWGVIASFRTDGTQTATAVRFPSRMYGTIRTFRDGGDIFTVEVPYGSRANFTINARRSDGSLDSRFANHGVAQIRAPGGDYAESGFLLAGEGEIILDSKPSEGPYLHLIRLRLRG